MTSALPITGRPVGFILVGCSCISVKHIDELRHPQPGPRISVAAP